MLRVSFVKSIVSFTSSALLIKSLSDLYFFKPFKLESLISSMSRSII